MQHNDMVLILNKSETIELNQEKAFFSD